MRTLLETEAVGELLPSSVTAEGQVTAEYVAGFFDGEGAVAVHAPTLAATLDVRLTIPQKWRPILECIRKFLDTKGIEATIYTYGNGVSSLEIGEDKSIVAFGELTMPHLVVKRKQVEGTLRYVRGEMSGNDFLLLLHREYLEGRRKWSPLRVLRLTFPLTRTEAVKLAGEAARLKAREALKEKYVAKLKDIYARLPDEFDIATLQKAGAWATKDYARYAGRTMEALEWVEGRFVKLPPRFRKLVFRKKKPPQVLLS